MTACKCVHRHSVWSLTGGGAPQDLSIDFDGFPAMRGLAGESVWVRRSEREKLF